MNFDPLYPNLPPSGVQVRAFVELAERRFLCKHILSLVLSALEAAAVCGAKARESGFAAHIGAEFNDLLFPDTEETIQRDLESHYILRLFCCDGQHQDFFVKQETALCKARLSSLSSQQFNDFLRTTEMAKDTAEVSPRELSGCADRLAALEKPGYNRKYFRTRWTNCASLVAESKVYVTKGWVYLSEHRLISIITHHFHNSLVTSLSRLRLALVIGFSHILACATRCVPILSGQY